MRKLLSLFLLTLATALPAMATPTTSSASRDQSYFSYDDGGTVVRQSDDDRELEVRTNMPVYPGDEVITNRRGRSEIRLSDGNVLALDRATSVVLHSVLDSYEGDSSATIAELRYGKAIVYRSDDARETMRLDTNLASYVASREAIYSVENDTTGRDRVTVFGGTVEVRTPSRTTRVRAGEEVEIDRNGPYRFASDATAAADDFERWFLARAERYDRATESRYLDARHAYYEDELSQHGKWVFVHGLGWSWRPLVAAGWRPYYHGYWSSSRTGCLTWVSYEPWGWLPYHYGRWALDASNGWVWLPGSGYSPAWVYWWYGDGYMGWAPSGYWEAYRPYHDWAYRPYARNHADFGFGFYGRVRVNDIDLRPWTFVDSNTIISTRVDRAALTTDAIRSRLLRDGSGFGTVSSAPARFTRQEFKNPAAAINRRLAGAGGSTINAGPIEDMTPFIRREADLQPKFRDRIIRTRGGEPSLGGTRAGLAPAAGGSSVAPIGSGNVAPIGRGNVAPIGGGSLAPTNGDGGVYRGGPNTGASNTPASADRGNDWRTNGGRISRGAEPVTEPVPSTRGSIGRNRDASPAPAEPAERDSGRVWRDRAVRPSVPATPVDRSTTSAPERTPSVDTGSTPAERSGSRNGDSWRGRVRGVDPSPAPATRSAEPAPVGGSDRGDISRRVIDRIGGARIQPGSGESAPSGRAAGSRGTRDTSTSAQASRPAPAPAPAPSSSSSSSGSSQRSSGSGSGGGKIDRSQGQPQQ